jgi:hypothetical protein
LIGAPEEIRTPDPQIRSLVLYPAELRALLRVGRAVYRHLAARLSYRFQAIMASAGRSGLAPGQSLYAKESRRRPEIAEQS